MRRRWTLSVVVLAAALWPPGEARALGLRSSFKELVVEGLEPGRAQKTSALTGRKLRLENTGGERVEVEMRLEKPRDAELKDGYEPLPDPSWVGLTAASHVLRAGAAGESDLVVAVPAGQERSGKRWQAQWVSVGRSPEGLRLEVRSSLLLRTQGPPRTPRKPAARQAEYLVRPETGTARKVALGRAVDLRREHGVALKLSNLGARKESFRVAVEESAEGAEAVDAFPPAPDPAFLKPAVETLEVEPGKMAEVGLSLEVPDQGRYRGRSWMFIVSVEPLEAAGRKTFFRLFVTTRKEATKP